MLIRTCGLIISTKWNKLQIQLAFVQEYGGEKKIRFLNFWHDSAWHVCFSVFLMGLHMQYTSYALKCMPNATCQGVQFLDGFRNGIRETYAKNKISN